METRDVGTKLVLRERERRTEYRLPVMHTATPGLGADEDEGRYAYDHAWFEAAQTSPPPRTAGRWGTVPRAAREVRRQVGSGHVDHLEGQVRAVPDAVEQPLGDNGAEAAVPVAADDGGDGQGADGSEVGCVMPARPIPRPRVRSRRGRVGASRVFRGAITRSHLRPAPFGFSCSWRPADGGDLLKRGFRQGAEAPAGPLSGRI
ncbi:hypothetical protein GCM10010254_29910 [Streptomyces chromofuscus]|nr:hypothetical protein GCM10010254_29910 [Streptomyces chromofuscus]